MKNDVEPRKEDPGGPCFTKHRSDIAGYRGEYNRLTGRRSSRRERGTLHDEEDSAGQMSRENGNWPLQALYTQMDFQQTGGKVQDLRLWRMFGKRESIQLAARVSLSLHRRPKSWVNIPSKWFAQMFFKQGLCI